MNRKKMVASGVGLVLVASLLWVPGAIAQAKYPTRGIDIVVPFSAGGSVDLTARIAGTFIGKKWGVSVNVINKPGGNTVPACLEVYRSNADGYTILGDGQNSASILGAAYKDLPFQVSKRTFICTVNVMPLFINVPASSSFKTLQDLIAEVKKDPGNFTWASLGGVSTIDYHSRQFFKAIGVDVRKTRAVMCKGGSEAAVLTAGGQVKMSSNAATGILPLVRSGTIRVLATTGKKRDPQFPDAPTFEELGYPTVNNHNWNCYSGPPNIPSHIVEAWNAIVVEMLKNEETISKLKEIGTDPLYLNAADTKERVIKEMDEYNHLFSTK